MSTRTQIALALALLLPLGRAAGDEPPRLFHLADECLACHNGLTGPAGEDVSFGTDWRPGMMANAARDPYWHAAVRRESLDHPGAARAIEAECSICHMPMARATAHAGGAEGEVFALLPAGRSQAPLAPLAWDGVSCSLCHQLEAEGLGQPETLVGRFAYDAGTPWGARVVHGPYEVDAGRTRLMASATELTPTQGEHVRDAALCASCHTLITHALGPDGQVVGRLPEQVPYQEWLHSRYPSTQDCQGCHMRALAEGTAIAGVWGRPRDEARQHAFLGGNFFVLGLLNTHRAELGVRALPQELELAAERNRAHLAQAAARLELTCAWSGERLEATVAVRNLAGHKLPSAYPSRRAWLHLQVRDQAGGVLFESGRLEPDGSIAGNDNDQDAGRHEPHHERIETADQVQLYEPILGDPDGRVTTGLLTATGYLKDNRLLPEGFDKAAAGKDIAVHGAAARDADFQGGGDVIRYSLALPRPAGPLTVAVALAYQPIGYRWAHNLGEARLAAAAGEPGRFLRYYQGAAGSSAVILAAAEARLEAP
ncbi:MAG TPA: hypothetical protein PK668_12020 [Myxococcota bacterium]|nr:hypothetical protein [Myxococcota bacterium]HRY93806.1 hypothetical protein [Myxococcota bacterium]HSA23455.1 hypothetical protein [Myxococcota bacterium]